MAGLCRLSLSIEGPLNQRLDELMRESGYTNRSEFVRDLIRDRLVAREWDRDAVVVGVLTLVYDHHVRTLSNRLTHLQHHHHDAILATTHVHLDERMCVEMTLMRGQARHLREVADLLRQQKGVLHATLSMSSTGACLE
jgi:CopG family nickel-responsive transcriptional regulator